MRSEREIHRATQFFEPARLTLAREIRGLTKSELARRIDKSASAIGQFESGKTRPDAGSVLRLALVLGVSPAFFTHRSRTASPIAMDGCHFRSLRSARQRDRRKLLAIATLLSDLVGLLEQYVDLPKECVSEVTHEVSSAAEIEECADDVRRRWGLGLGPIPNVVQLLESKGIVLCPVTEGSKRVDGFTLWHLGRPYVFLVLDKGSTSRSRYDACHELGHLVMHADVRPGNPEAEREAERFAAAFLLPRESFGQECPHRLNWSHFYELKRRWRVSVQALIRRAKDLGRITEASYRRAFVHLNKTGERLKERDEPPAEQPQILAKAVALASNRIPIEQIASDSGLGDTNFRSLMKLLQGEDGVFTTDGCVEM